MTTKVTKTIIKPASKSTGTLVTSKSTMQKVSTPITPKSTTSGVKRIVKFAKSDKPSIGKVAQKIKGADDGKDEIFQNDDVWIIVDSFFEFNSLVRHQIEDFNHFVHTLSHIVIDKIGTWKIIQGDMEYRVKFQELFFAAPKISEADGECTHVTPMEALHRNVSYVSEIYIDVIIIPPSGIAQHTSKVHLGAIPVMVRSDLCNTYTYRNSPVDLASKNECQMDKGGYFIIRSRGAEAGNGNTAQRRVLCLPERTVINRVFVFASRKSVPKFEHYAEIKSLAGIVHSTTTIVGWLGRKVGVVLPWIDGVAIPLGVVFRAMGVKTETEMLKIIWAGFAMMPQDKQRQKVLETLSSTFEYTFECPDEEAALYYIGSRGKKFQTQNEIDASIEEHSTDDDDADDISPLDEDIPESAKNIKKLMDVLASPGKDKKKDSREEAISYARHLLESELFPHLGIPGDMETDPLENATAKRYFLGYMVAKLLETMLGFAPPEDRDHDGNKRVLGCGSLFFHQFYWAIRRLQSEITNNAKKAMSNTGAVNILSWIKSNIVTNAMVGAIANNKWGARGNSPTTKGIAQLYEQFNYAAGLANQRKMVIPMAAEGVKIIGPRDLNGSQWGVKCPSETPEGKKTGLIGSMALTGMITQGCDAAIIEKLIRIHIPILAFTTPLKKSTNTRAKILINGKWLGWVEDPIDIITTLRSWRRRATISFETGLTYDIITHEIRIATDAGRRCRPLIRIDEICLDGVSKPIRRLAITIPELERIKAGEITWKHLLVTGKVEIIDKDEEEYLRVALYPSDLFKPCEGEPYTHCELHASLMYGIGGSVIPYPNRNQSPRNCYQAAMSKQSVGLPFLNYREMMSGSFHVMGYLQKPLMTTRAASIIGFDEMPAGQNATVFVMPRDFDEEDSIEMNSSSVDRGFMVSYKFVCFYIELRQEKEQFGIPSTELCGYFKGNPKLLDVDGIISPGEHVKDGDILVGKLSRRDDTHGTDKTPFISNSLIFDLEMPAVVDRVQRGTTGDGYQYIRVSVSQKRRPVAGDKFCFSPDHEVLTSVGWIPIAEVTKDHLVASLKVDGQKGSTGVKELEETPMENITETLAEPNVEKHFLVYEHPTQILSFDNDEPMIEVDTNQVAFRVTPNHRMYVKMHYGKNFEFREVETLFDTPVYYKKNAIWDVPGLDHFELPAVEYRNSKHVITTYPKRKMAIEPWILFFGVWMSEGYAREKHSINFSARKDRVRAALFISCADMEIEYTVSKDGNCVMIYDLQMINYFSKLSVGDTNKKLPDWVWNLNAKQSGWLLEAMILGDGASDNTPMYTTSSKDLKNDVMRLALHAGWAANAYIFSPKGDRKRDGVTNVGDIAVDKPWKITIVKTQLEPAVNKHIKNQQKWVDYTGKVYCCTVPNGLLYVRRTFSGTDGVLIGAKTSQRPAWIANSAMHSQKGTVGQLVSQENMPFECKTGISPDIIVNSLAFPSRMTIGMLVECLGGKAIALTSSLHNYTVRDIDGRNDTDGTFDRLGHDDKADFEKMYRHPKTGLGDATPFRDDKIEEISKELKKMGLDGWGDEMVCDGITGELSKVLVYTGPIYYQRLKHMVVDKVHARARGPRTTLSHQPTDGRAADGGLRVGVQERDCMLAQGGSRFVRDRMLEQSDEYRMWVCSICGLPQTLCEEEKELRACPVCGSSQIARIRIPYGTKLIIQEMMGMNIVPRILPEM